MRHGLARCTVLLCIGRCGAECAVLCLGRFGRVRILRRLSGATAKEASKSEAATPASVLCLFETGTGGKEPWENTAKRKLREPMC